jgi:starch synthase
MARVMMVASEAVPFVKSGGLADVVTSLAAALRSSGHDVIVLLPRYVSVDLSRADRVVEALPVFLGSAHYDTSIYHIDGEVPFYFLDCPSLYARTGLYGEDGMDYPDNHIRFAVLAKAAIDATQAVFPAQIIHCHDWQAGLVPAFLRRPSASESILSGIKTLFTIHNLGYQGLFPRTALEEVGLTENEFHIDGVEFYGKVSFIKAGLNYADALNTISPTYAREIQTPEYGFGLDGLLRARADVLTGILNGVDYREWDPEHDPVIPAAYSKDNLAGKRICKEQLLEETGLSPSAMDRPLIGMVSRLTSQKGADLVAEALEEIVALDMYLVALGAGEPTHEELFRTMALRHPGRVSVVIGYNNALAHRVEAGADIFLMPSRYEPCGLNQIFSLRYGTVPLVRATGGLDDTVDSNTGFKFWQYSGVALVNALRQAEATFRDRVRWNELIRNCMEKDFSWRYSANAYSAVYQSLLQGQRQPRAPGIIR